MENWQTKKTFGRFYARLVIEIRVMARYTRNRTAVMKRCHVKNPVDNFWDLASKISNIRVASRCSFAHFYTDNN